MATIAQMPHWKEICSAAGAEILRLGSVHHTLATTKDLAGLRALHSNPQVDPCCLDQLNIALTAPGKNEIDLLAQEGREKTVKAQQLSDETSQRLLTLGQEFDSLNTNVLAQELLREREEARLQITAAKELHRECDDEDFERRKRINQVFLDAGFSQGEIDGWNTTRSKKEFFKIRRARWADLQQCTTDKARELIADGHLAWNGRDGLSKAQQKRKEVLDQLVVADRLRIMARHADEGKLQAKKVVKELEELQKTGEERLERLRLARADAADRKQDKRDELNAKMLELLQLEREYKDSAVELQICQVGEETLVDALANLGDKLAEAQAAASKATQVYDACRTTALDGEARVKREVEMAARTCETKASGVTTEAALTHQMVSSLLKMQFDSSKLDRDSIQKQLDDVKEQLRSVQEALKTQVGVDENALQEEVPRLLENSAVLSEALADVQARLHQQEVALLAAASNLEKIFKLDGFGQTMDKEDVERQGSALADECYKRFGPIPLNLEASPQGPSFSFKPLARSSTEAAGNSDALQPWSNPNAFQDLLRDVTKEAVKQAQAQMLEQQTQSQTAILQTLKMLQESNRLMAEQNREMQEKLRQLEDDRTTASPTGSAIGTSSSLPPC